MKLHPILTLIVLTSLLFSGCMSAGERRPANSPPIAFTAAALTLDAQLTQAGPQTPAGPLATQTPIGGPTLSGAASPAQTETLSPAATTLAGTTVPCDAAKFVMDVTIPDHTLMSGDQTFTKTWRLANIGTCAWNSSYTLVFDTGDLMGGPASLPLPQSVAPGATVDLSVPLQAPSANGSYRGFWRLRNPSGAMLPISGGYNDRSFYVDIQVKGSGFGRTFIVTDVTFAVSHTGDCSSGTYTVSAKVTTSGAGSVSYVWRRSDGLTDTLSNGTLTYSAAGTQTISYAWPSGATGLSMILYVDNPNHHEFGPALLNCP